MRLVSMLMPQERRIPMVFGAFSATIAMLVAIALVFDFMNGFRDATNSIATVGKGIVDPAIVDNHVILRALIGGLIAAAAWWLGWRLF